MDALPREITDLLVSVSLPTGWGLGAGMQKTSICSQEEQIHLFSSPG